MGVLQVLQEDLDDLAYSTFHGFPDTVAIAGPFFSSSLSEYVEGVKIEEDSGAGMEYIYVRGV